MNPEDVVIDEIDKLVDQTMAAAVDRHGRPLDDYTRDLYPRCDDCSHQWHGVGCVYCDCPGQNGEPGGEQPHYLDRIESVRYTDNREGRSWTILPSNHGYTLSQLEAMRWNCCVESIYRAQLGPEGLTTGLQ